VIALMYHDIVAAGAEDSSGFPGRDAALYKLTPETFAAHLDAIQRSTPGLRDSPDKPAPLITFDDGGASALRAADLLDRHARVGHFFVTTNYIGTRGFLTEGDIRELSRRGHLIGSHSCSHPLRMGHCPWPQLLDEWSRSCAILGDIVGGEVRMASVPGGDFAPQVAEAAARTGVTRLFTSEPTSGVWNAFGLSLIGRFAIQRGTSAGTAAALAAGDWLPCACQAVVWKAKKMSKRLGGEQYLRLRKILLRHGDEVQWGDGQG
jgi:peptidoglycan/xylan/chitin deacetylase (PgdA/CDA1 family)